MALSAFASAPLLPGDTLIFFDGIQEAADLDLITFSKLLVEDGKYRFVFSGSLLGVSELARVSYPVGYLERVTMFPLTFFEFITAHGVHGNVVEHIEECFETAKLLNRLFINRFSIFGTDILWSGVCLRRPDIFRHEFRAAAQQRFRENGCFVSERHQKPGEIRKRPYIEWIYETLPEPVNQKNRRFALKNKIAPCKSKKEENDFVWIVKAGVAIPVYAVSEPKPPLRISMESRLMKLFLPTSAFLRTV